MVRVYTSNRDNHSLDRIVEPNQFKKLDELLSEWTEAGLSTTRATMQKQFLETRFKLRSLSQAAPEPETASLDILPGLRR